MIKFELLSNIFLLAKGGGKLVVLLVGGDKSTQSRDIEQAKIYWKEYKDHA